ncbi:hypothetical protein SUDANB145_07161 (plasmid) [Streptomyces sp. enrichment culture]|uniref:hypothetical protein n=1 Tax=Streptomyces sp. enrichment culture TaxID=1795815 RepID=UPI003F54A7FC
MATALALFDLTALNPDQPVLCSWCRYQPQPATTRVHARMNLLGTYPTWGADARYRHVTRRARSGPCCDECAAFLAGVWWGHNNCSRGTCWLWARTLADPNPAHDCTRHHRELTVVWRERLVTA